MKKAGLFLCLVLFSCALQEGEKPFSLEFPSPPAPWTELLGNPRWLVRYHGEGAYQETEGELSLPPSAAGPVLAWPYWPDRGLEPGDFRPAGLVLPYDAWSPEGDRHLILSWQGGVEAWFYEELERAALDRASQDGGNLEDLPRGGDFNWPRFRALFSDPSVPQEIREDPWRADWGAIAEKTIRSGFRKQWLTAMETSSRSIPVPPGRWVSPSPFASSLDFETSPGIFPVGPGPGVQAWYSAGGILHCSGESWIFLPWD
jgi:hypothetical protein